MARVPTDYNYRDPIEVFSVDVPIPERYRDKANNMTKATIIFRGATPSLVLESGNEIEFNSLSELRNYCEDNNIFAMM